MSSGNPKAALKARSNAGRAKPQTLSMHIMNLIGREIVTGVFSVGTTLPTEPELCARFQVSRTPLREAIKKLHGKRLLIVGPKTGTRVLPQSDWNQLDQDVLRWRLQSGPDLEILRQLYELRGAFEPEACRLAAENGNASDHAAIAAALKEIERNQFTVEAVVNADVDFHMAIIAATRNMFFLSLSQAIRTALDAAFWISAKSKTFPAAELEQHRRIAEAILARRGEAASGAMEKLLGLSRDSAGLGRGGESESPAKPSGEARG